MTNIPNAFDRLMKAHNSTSKADENSKEVDNPDQINLEVESQAESSPIISQSQEGISNFQQNLFYNFFVKVSTDLSKCITCYKVLKTPSSTTTTLKRHLKTHLTVFLKYQTSVKEKLLKVKETEVVKRKIEDTT